MDHKEGPASYAGPINLAPPLRHPAVSDRRVPRRLRGLRPLGVAKIKRPRHMPGPILAPPRGLEPRTWWLHSTRNCFRKWTISLP